jgi:hypothetical protein
MISQDPKVWGPHAWTFLDSIVASFPNDLTSSETEADIERMFNFWNSLYLPCKECMVHYIEFLAVHPIETVNNKSTYEAWYNLLKKNVFQHKQSQQITIPSSPQVHIPSSPASRIKSIRNLPIPTVYQNKNLTRYGSRISRSKAPGSSMLSTIPTYSNSTNPLAAAMISYHNTSTQQRQSKDPSRGARGCSSCGGGTRAILPKR